MWNLKGRAVTIKCDTGDNLIISNQVNNHFVITLGRTTVTIPKEQFMDAVIKLSNEMYIEKGDDTE